MRGSSMGRTAFWSIALALATCSRSATPSQPMPIAEQPSLGARARNYVLLLDRSDGVQGEKSLGGCDTLQKLADRIVKAVSEQNEARSVLQAYATGTRQSIGTVLILEPTHRRRIPTPPLPPSIENPPDKYNRAKANWEAKRLEIDEEWLAIPATLLRECRAKAAQTNFSPLFAALHSGLSECGKSKLPCVLVFITDLQENAEPAIARAISSRTNAGREGGDGASLPKPLDAHGATVRICGLTQSRSNQGGMVIPHTQSLGSVN
jgi:hypothetical protein